MDCGALARRIKGALQTQVSAVEVEHESAAMAALSFVHPAHDAMVMVVISDGEEPVAMRTTSVLMVLGDWDAIREDEAEVRRMFSLNARLMGCAVALVPLNDQETAVVLCRRMPSKALAPEEVLPLVDDMAWEYAVAAGWTRQAEHDMEDRFGQPTATGMNGEPAPQDVPTDPADLTDHAAPESGGAA